MEPTITNEPRGPLDEPVTVVQFADRESFNRATKNWEGDPNLIDLGHSDMVAVFEPHAHIVLAHPYGPAGEPHTFIRYGDGPTFEKALAGLFNHSTLVEARYADRIVVLKIPCAALQASA